MTINLNETLHCHAEAGMPNKFSLKKCIFRVEHTPPEYVDLPKKMLLNMYPSRKNDLKKEKVG